VHSQARERHAPAPGLQKIGQFTQVAPPVPQALVAVPTWQEPAEQQPLAQLAALQTQVPATHC
jgi:hypothetical protein